MNPLSALYSSVVSARNALYDRDILKARKLSWPVISVGNISVGGSGKTPFVITLGSLLGERGIAVDVLSRGYGRSSTGVLSVHEDGMPESFGDEPLLIARKLHCPVFVASRRYAAGRLAERARAGAALPPMHLLDDGFQHRQLYPDFSIVLINDDDLQDSLLPVGRLREPVASLARADAVVVSQTFPVGHLPIGKFQIWRARRRSNIPSLQAPVVAFCGIARPQRFFDDLRQYGLDVRAEFNFPDHHRYSPADVAKLFAAKLKMHGAHLVTTEKDAINLGPHFEELSPVVIPLEVELQDADSCLNHMLKVIAERRGS
jgi:tetraacyldisaccharide 4'-kinase